MTTLTDLKRAIARVEEYRAMPLHDRLLHCHAFAVAEREGWRAAFEWINDIVTSRIGDGAPLTYDEGMALIREKLQP